MNRTGLLIALCIAAGAGLLFGLFPQSDIAISRLFFHASASSFPMPGDAMDALREGYSWLIAAFAAPGFVALAFKLIWPRRPMLIPARAAVLLVATIALAPGLMTNIILKDHWGRSRPYAVTQFGGAEKYTAWWDPRGGCSGNCSFVAGEPSGAFWTLAPAAVLTPAPYRPLAYGMAIAFGIGVGILRMTYGAHFASDTIFAGLFVYLVIWLVYGLLYRWPATRMSDQRLERWIASLSLPIHDALFAAPNREAKRKQPAGRSRAGRKRSRRASG